MASASPQTGAPSSTGVGATYTTGAYAAPPLFMPSRDASGLLGSGVSGLGSGEPTTFTVDDRMLLKMVYHQQQAMHVQLNALSTWVQHCATLLANVDRHLREQQRRPPSSAPRYVDNSFDGTHGAEDDRRGGYGAAGGASTSIGHSSEGSRGRQLHTTASAATPPSTNDDTQMADQPSQGPPPALQNALSAQPIVRPRQPEPRPASTPPGEEQAPVAAAGARTPYAQDATSAMNLSVESVGNVWDPSKHVPRGPHPSTRSSRSGSAVGGASSQLGRQENPLLAARPLAAAGRPSHSNSQNTSVSHTMDTTGNNTTSDNTTVEPVSHYFRETAGRGRSQPVIGRPQSGGTAASLARAMGERDIPSFRSVDNRERARMAAEPATATATTSLLSRGPREAPRLYATAGSTTQRHSRPTTPRTGSTQLPSTQPPPPPTQRTPVGRGASGVASHSATGSGGNAPEGSGRPRVRQTSGGSVREAPHERHHREALHRLDVELETDSLSDGYGSYDSRQYMKSVGLL